MILDEALKITIMAAASFAVAFVAAPLWYRVLVHYKFGKQIRTTEDAPVFSKLHAKKEGVPTGGGVIIWGTVVALAIVFQILAVMFDGFFGRLNFISRSETYVPLGMMLFAAVLGFVDDWLGVLRRGGAKGGGLKVRHKLVMYGIVAAVAAWWFYFKLGRTTVTIPLLPLLFPGMQSIDIGLWYIAFFMFIMVATAFSANETDGLDGLLGGVSLFAFAALTTVAFVTNLFDLAAFGAAMIGSLLAFLWFNIYPAKFIMGDTGSMAIGATIGTLALLTNTPLLLPFFGIILVLESLSVIVQLISKRLRGRKIFLSTPIHHHFEALGWPESQVTMRFWIISAVCSMIGLAIFFLHKALW